MAVNVTGAALASLFFDISDIPHDQVGFLFGHVGQHVTDSVSDSQINQSHVETTINVLSHVPIRNSQKLFDRSGTVSTEIFHRLLGNKTKKIVGWYKKRSNTVLRPSLRERSCHRNLLKCLNHVSHENFVLCLCSDSATSNQSTISLDHAFYVCHDRTFKPLSMKVTNLGTTTSADYRRKPNPVDISSMINQFTSDFEDEAGVSLTSRKMEKMCGHLQNKLQALCTAVVDGETGLRRMERKIEQLEARVLKKRQEVAASRKADVKDGPTRPESSNEELVDLKPEDETGVGMDVHDSVMRSLKTHGLLELNASLTAPSPSTSHHGLATTANMQECATDTQQHNRDTVAELPQRNDATITVSQPHNKPTAADMQQHSNATFADTQHRNKATVADTQQHSKATVADTQQHSKATVADTQQRSKATISDIRDRNKKTTTMDSKPVPADTGSYLLVPQAKLEIGTVGVGSKVTASPGTEQGIQKKAIKATEHFDDGTCDTSGKQEEDPLLASSSAGEAGDALSNTVGACWSHGDVKPASSMDDAAHSSPTIHESSKRTVVESRQTIASDDGNSRTAVRSKNTTASDTISNDSSNVFSFVDGIIEEAKLRQPDTRATMRQRPASCEESDKQACEGDSVTDDRTKKTESTCVLESNNAQIDDIVTGQIDSKVKTKLPPSVGETMRVTRSHKNVGVHPETSSSKCDKPKGNTSLYHLTRSVNCKK